MLAVSEGQRTTIQKGEDNEKCRKMHPRPAAINRKVRPANKSDKGKCDRAHNHTKISAEGKLFTGKCGERDARGRCQPTTHVGLHSSWSHGARIVACKEHR